MPSTIVQFRTDEDLKNEASALFEELGIDLSTALRLFLTRCVKERGIPFDVKLDDEIKKRKQNEFRAEHEGRR